jgi:Rne/Rng family ribonuclease
LQPATPADSSALAPFAEDIEIDESLAAAAQAPRRQPTGRDMLINVVEGEEVRIAVVRRGLLEELYMERSSTESHIGNIYKGRVTNVEPSIQAAFIDFGIGKNGFLHISDLHPQYFPKRHQPKMPLQQRRNGQGQRPPTPRPQAPQGFVPPAQQAAIDRAAAIEDVPATPVGETPMAHGINVDAPAVAFDHLEGVSQSTADIGMQESTTAESVVEGPAVEEAPAEHLSVTEAGSGLERAIEQVAPDPAPIVAGPDDEAEADEESGEAEPAEETPEPLAAEEPADFGSAYNSEFDDEFDDHEGTDALDDGHMKPMEKVGRKTPRRDRPPIQQCLRRGQEVIVQVTKEGIGTKGPTLTTYVSCPGRYLVMMPGMAQLGVSRKIEDLEQRRELKRTLQELNPPRNLGFIIRTAGTEVSKKELQGDLNYLVRMWKVIANRIRTHKAPVELYQESDLVIRTIRDVFTDEIDRIIVDNEQVASRVRDFLSIVDPRSAGLVELYTGTMPLFQKFGVEREIEKINSRRVELPNGGSLIIDSAEALVAIDVNSGRYREQRDAELTAFNMNKEALKEVVRQLRLRDLGGVIVIDFIDMREERHKREIERLLREEMKNDRAKTKVLRMSQFCMIEMTRQRVRPSLKRSIYMDCPHCHGSALIKTPESVSLDVMRRLAAGTTRMDVVRLEVRAYPTVATFLLNRKRKALVDLEEKTGKRINITPDEGLAGDQIVIQPYDVRGSLLSILL